MKNGFKLATAALLVATFTTAASAQTYGVPGVDYGYPPYTSQQPVRGHSVTPATPERVYENGKMIGQDPDANVRMMLHKDFSFQ